MTIQEAAKLIALGLTNWQYAAKSMTKEETQNLARMWAYAMPDIPYDVGQAAIMKLVRTSKFLPQVSEIVEAAESLMRKLGDPPAAEDAWAEVVKQLNPYQAPVFSHDLIRKTVACMGYTNLVHSENPLIDRAQFLKIYGQYLKRHEVERLDTVVMRLCSGKVNLIGQ